MKKNKKFLQSELVAAICFGLFLSSFFACSDKNLPQLDSDFIELAGAPSSKENLTEKPTPCKITNKRILVLFGYDFNSPEIVRDLTSQLSDLFGLDSDEGLIYPVVYPADFKHNSRDYPNELAAILQNSERELAGVVILGAPEKTHVALAKNQDKWNQKTPYAVVALFPQDEGLGLESTCDFVLDKGSNARAQDSIENNAEEAESVWIKEAPEILIAAINYVQKIDGHLDCDSKIQQHAKQMFKNFKIFHYIDTETGLPSVNHFILN